MSGNAELDTKEALFASAPLVALVGTNDDGVTKIFPDEIPEKDQVPAVVYERSDSQPEHTLDGTLVASRVAMSVTGWAKTRAAANALLTAITNAMEAGQFALTGTNVVHETELDEYAAVGVFDVWEFY